MTSKLKIDKKNLKKYDFEVKDDSLTLKFHIPDESDWVIMKDGKLEKLDESQFFKIIKEVKQSFGVKKGLRYRTDIKDETLSITFFILKEKDQKSYITLIKQLKELNEPQLVTRLEEIREHFVDNTVFSFSGLANLEDFIAFNYHVILWKEFEHLSSSSKSKANTIFKSFKKKYEDRVLSFFTKYKIKTYTNLAKNFFNWITLNKKYSGLKEEKAKEITKKYSKFLVDSSKLTRPYANLEEKKFFPAFKNSFKEDSEKYHESVNFLVKKSKLLNDNDLKLVVKNLRPEQVEDDLKVSSKNYEKNYKEFQKSNSSMFNGKAPTIEDLEKITPVKRKKYNKLKADTKKSLAVLTESLIDSRVKSGKGDYIISIDDLKNELKKTGVENLFAEEFDGHVSIRAGNFVFYSPDKKELSTAVGFMQGVKKNQNYDPSTDKEGTNAVYTFLNGRDNEVDAYTIDFKVNNDEEKFSDVEQLAEMIPDLRNQWDKDINSKNIQISLSAMIVKVVDTCYGRIGGKILKKSELIKEKKRYKQVHKNSTKPFGQVYGIHSLRKKHCTIEEKNGKEVVKIIYNGKKQEKQRHIISDAVIVKFFKKIVNKDTIPSKHFIFSYGKTTTGKTKRIKPTQVNSYLKSTGFPAEGIHKFRTYHATRIAIEKLLEKDLTGSTNKQLNDYFIKIATEISKTLGQAKWDVPIKNYVNPKVTKQFFEKYNIPIPTNIFNLIKHFKSEAGFKETGFTKTSIVRYATKELQSISDMKALSWFQENQL